MEVTIKKIDPPEFAEEKYGKYSHIFSFLKEMKLFDWAEINVHEDDLDKLRAYIGQYFRKSQKNIYKFQTKRHPMKRDILYVLKTRRD